MMSHPTKQLLWGLASFCGLLTLTGNGNVALALVLIFGWLLIQHLVFGGFANFVRNLMR